MLYKTWYVKKWSRKGKEVPTKKKKNLHIWAVGSESSWLACRKCIFAVQKMPIEDFVRTEGMRRLI